MNRREKLIDNYENALFAVLMDKVAEEEGAKLREENQQLRNDPEAAVPVHVDAVAKQTIRKAFAGQNRRSALHVARRVLNTVAIIVLICSVVFVTAYAAFPEVRVKMLNLLIQSSDVASRLVLVENENNSNRISDEEIVLCGYSIPRLKSFSVAEYNEDKHGGWILFESERGEAVRIDIVKSAIHYVDTEDADIIENVDIHGYLGMIIEKNNQVTVTWSDKSQSMNITLTCDNLSRSFVLKTAEQIVSTAQ